MWCNGGWRERLGGDVPFEFICEVARARALAEAGHVEGGAAAARHFCSGGLGERGDVAVVGDGCRGRGGRWWSRERERESGMARRKSNGRKELLACCKRNRFQSLALGRNRGSSSHVQTSSPGTCTLLRASGQRRCRVVFREVHLHTPEHQEITLLRFSSANWKHYQTYIPT
jgi:hypothetical protein